MVCDGGEVSFLMREYPHMPKILKVNKASASALDRLRHIKKVCEEAKMEGNWKMGRANMMDR